MSLRFLVFKSRRWLGEVCPTLRLAAPIMTGMVAQTLMGLADTIMVGRVGVVPLAAASFVNALTHLPMVFAFGFLSSIAVLTSRAFGAQDTNETGEVLRHGLVLAFGAGLFSALGSAAFWPVLGWFGQPAEVAEASGTYLLLFGGSLLPALFAHGGKQFSEALNHPWPPMLILLGSVLLNIFLNWILIYGHWGAPALGLEGAGWATLISRIVLAAAMMTFVLKGSCLRPFRPVRWAASFSRQRFQWLVSLGWPVGLQHLLEVSAFVVAALMMGWISAEALAAHQIAITCAATSFMVAFGLGMAVCIRVGQAWGARRFHRLRRIGFVGLGLAAGWMSLCGLLFVLAGEVIARLFVGSSEVVALAARLLFIAAFFQVADGLQVVAISALRGLADVRVPAIIAALSYWVIAVPAAYFLAFHVRLEAAGIWVGLAAGLASAALALTWRFHVKTNSAILVFIQQRRPEQRGASVHA